MAILLRASQVIRHFASTAAALGCFFATCHSQAQNVKTLEVRPRTGEYAGKTFYTNSHALLIGIGQYAHLPKDKWLDYAVSDARDLRDVLIRSYGFLPENVTVLLNEQATKAKIEAALASLSDDNLVKKDDRLFVFFSGHGQTVKLANGGDMGFLIPFDANVDLSHPDNRGPYLASCVEMESIWRFLQASPAKHSLLIADACYGGLLTRSRALTEKPNASVIAGLLTRPALEALTAGSSDQETIEDPNLGHGAFTYKLLEELRAHAATPDDVFLSSELAAKLKVSVGNLTNGKQTPQFGNYDNTEGEFVFVTQEPRTVPPLNIPGTPVAKSTAHDVPVNTDVEKITLPGGIAGRLFRGNSRPQSALAGDVWVNPKDGAEMVYIPAGQFQMGDDDDADITKLGNPRHIVKLSGYWIYKNLVTVGQYKSYCEAMNLQMPPAPDFDNTWTQDDHPMVDVSWDDAQGYCAWAGVHLPTEAQWEKAARGPNGAKFPWGDTFDADKVWASKTLRRDAYGTTAVGQFGRSGYGLSDMAGNVWQWCTDWYDQGFWSTQASHSADPVNLGLGEQKFRVVRGGSWVNIGPLDFRGAYRGFGLPANQGIGGGFRCASGP